MAIASSRHLETDHPDVALALYPLNAEAFIADTVVRLNRQDADARLEEMEAQVRRAVPANAGDARIYSLLGEILRRRGEADTAYAMFDHALALASTEIHALNWTIQRAVAAAEYDKAAEALDLMFRRWPGRIGTFAAAVPQVFSQADSYEVLLEMLAAAPPWRSRLISALARGESDDLAFTARLLQDLALGSSPPSPSETAQLIASLFRYKQYDLAYRTFLLTLAPQERELSGFVFNGQFRQGPSGRRFDWGVRQQPGMVLSLPSGPASGSSGYGLSLEFSGTPVLRIGLEQYLSLPSGAYEIEFNASATAAELPKSLMWAIDCVDPGQPIVRVEVPAGTYQDRSVRDVFTIPQNCPVQTLTLRTNAMVESWSNRYTGKVLFHDIRILAVQS